MIRNIVDQDSFSQAAGLQGFALVHSPSDPAGALATETSQRCQVLFSWLPGPHMYMWLCRGERSPVPRPVVRLGLFRNFRGTPEGP